MTVDHPARPKCDAGWLAELMRRYQQADIEAGNMLVEALSPQLFNFFLANCRNRAVAEDLLQDLWLRIHNARHTYREDEPVLPWLYAIAHRVRIDGYRKSRRHAAEVTDGDMLQSVAAPSPQPTYGGVTEILKQLPDSQREVLLMMKVSGLTLEEVARATGSTVGAVKQKAHRAYEKLRSLWMCAHEL